MNSLISLVRNICLIIGTIALVSCIILSKYWLMIACIIFLVIIVLIYIFLNRKEDFPGILKKIDENKRKDTLTATVISINRGVDKEFRPYEQLICEYAKDNGKKIIFKSPEVLGKSDVKIGDLCHVTYEKNNYKNYMVVPFHMETETENSLL